MIASKSTHVKPMGRGTVHPIHKRIHAMRGAHNVLSYMVRLIEEEPEFFATGDGKEYLESVKTRHLPSLEIEISYLRDQLPPEEL